MGNGKCSALTIVLNLRTCIHNLKRRLDGSFAAILRWIFLQYTKYSGENPPCLAANSLVQPASSAVNTGSYICAALAFMEGRTLNQMAEGCDVDLVCVLDIYRYRKANWMLDLGSLLVLAFVAVFGVIAIHDLWKKRKTMIIQNGGNSAWTAGLPKNKQPVKN